MKNRILLGVLLSVVVTIAGPSTVVAQTGEYLILPGDILGIAVWKEEDLNLEVLVRPDGKFSFPLIGEVTAAGRSAEDIRKEIVAKLDTYIPDVVATVLVREIVGNRAYVIGKVLRPGPFVMTDNTDVMQALSIAGGTANFASLKNIIILRRAGSSGQQAIPFNYNQVEDGENLEQNITLLPGDVVVVP